MSVGRAQELSLVLTLTRCSVTAMSVVYLDRRTTVLAAAALCGVFIAGILIGHFGSGFAGSSGSSSEAAGGVSPLSLGRREGR